MSIARALSNAVSGLNAVSRGTETVAANIANAATPGYARRDVILSPQGIGANSGGVRIIGVSRAMNSGLLAEVRLAEAARSEAKVTVDFMTEMAEMIGLPGEAGSLGNRLSDFHTALVSASVRPDEELRLKAVVTIAEKLAESLNEASQAVQDARARADSAIAADVTALNAGLERVAYLNKRISILTAEGADASSLMDERQAVIDQISSIVPVQEVKRGNEQVALFTAEGAVLIDGSKPVSFGYTPVGQFTAEMASGTLPVGHIFQDGAEISSGGMSLFAGGSLMANFKIRDEHAPEIQQELDALAADLYGRFADAAVDPTLSDDEPGIFTDSGGQFHEGNFIGISGRIAVNSILTLDVWRVRSGLAADDPGSVGETSQILRMIDALTGVKAADSSSVLSGAGSMSKYFGDVEARFAIRRVSAEADYSIYGSRAEVMSARLMEIGVDRDFEMQRLISYEQSYAANARVIQVIDSMMDYLLRM